MKPPVRMLVVDDDAAIRRLFEEMVAPRTGATVATAAGAEEALDRLRHDSFDVILVDLKMPGMGGLELIERARPLVGGAPMVMVTAFGSIENAVEAVKLGAWDYLVKPFKLTQVERILDRVRRLKEPGSEEAAAERFRVPGLVGTTPTIEAVHAWTGKVRSVDSNVLVSGESGTGKELVARALHFEGRRKGGPFVAVDCGAIPPTLLESELFGHVKGAYTGAVSDREGLFGRADGGSLFLDEIGEMPLEVQAVLLRAIEERQIRPVGSSQTRSVDVRIIAATNRRLEEEVERGRFRQDLYYRLNVVAIEIPPLRRRKDDIPLLVDHFIGKLGRGVTGVTREALHALLRYDWPGNVRELLHAIERSAVMARGDRIELGDLPEGVVEVARRKGESTGTGRTLREQEAETLRTLLAQHGGDTAKVAGELGIDRSTVYRKAHRLGIDIRALGKAP